VNIKKIRRENPKILIVLVGPPGIGKSGWVRNFFGDADKFVVNRDDITLEVAKKRGLTYRDTFTFPPEGSVPGPNTDPEFAHLGDIVPSHDVFRSWGEPVYYRNVGSAKNEIERKFQSRMNQAVGKPVVLLDLTNMKATSRKKRNEMFPGYYKIAVVFPSSGSEEILKGIQENRTTHNVPPHICEEMIKTFEMPSKSEGFDVILKQDNRARLPVFLEYAKGEKALKAMHSAFEDSVRFLNEYAGTGFALQSGSAVAAVGVPRATTDVDYLILSHSGIDSVPDNVLPSFGLTRQQASRPSMRSFKHTSGADVDLDLPQSDLHVEAVQNAVQGKVDGIKIPVIPAPYLAIFKIQNAEKATGSKREKHTNDVKRVLDRSKPDISFIRSHLTPGQELILNEVVSNPKFATNDNTWQRIAKSLAAIRQ
jgi:predicted kinase